MQALQRPQLFPDLIGRPPTVGDLMGLCEENYRLLRRLAPDLPGLSGTLYSTPRDGADLFLVLLEQTRYTTELRLTHLFPVKASHGAIISERGDRVVATRLQTDPDICLRVYHDACQVDVLHLRQTALPLYRHYRHPALPAKWKANRFLSKWLRYCLREGHRFPAEASQADLDTPLELIPSC